VNWQIASIGVLAVALAAGFVWYERSRPTAKVLSLVATLAGLAVVGRIAFAPIPNVKPATTDIVLFAGYALGGAPGFAVGAVTALVSNLFFSQGPWTPWQMVGWGGVGIAGAGLARLAGGRELGRWPLAVACGLAGLGFGLILDIYQWTLVAEQSVASFVAVSATSLPYNAAHAIGNFLFCLLVGPPLLRSLSRYRRRLDVRWDPPPLAVIASCALAIAALAAPDVTAASSSPDATAASSAERAARFLERAQNADGGFGAAPAQSSTQLFSGWAALGLAAAGRNPRAVRRGRQSITEYIRTHARELDETGEIERTILVLTASGLSARHFAGRDLVGELVRRQRGDGSFEGAVNLTAFAVLALRASGREDDSPAVRRSLRWLIRQQGDDGGFGAGPRGGGSDVDDSAAVLQALAGRAGTARRRVVTATIAYLRRAQGADGGFSQLGVGASNAQSTAWAIQGLIAVGRDPERLQRGGRDPLTYLRSLQTAAGSVRYSRGSAQTPVWVTAQALIAFRKRSFPLAAVTSRERSKVSSPPRSSVRARSASDGGRSSDRASRRRRSDAAPSPPARETSSRARRASAHRRGGVRAVKPISALAAFERPPAETPADRDVVRWAALAGLACALGGLGWRRARARRRPRHRYR